MQERPQAGEKETNVYSKVAVVVYCNVFVLSSGASSDQIALVHFVLGFRQQDFLFVYLGISLYKGRSMVMLFDALLAKLRSRLHHWSSKLLSMGVRLFYFNNFCHQFHCIDCRYYLLQRLY